MIDVDDISVVLEELKKAQDADHDNREKAREADLFVSKRDGQWEPHWWTANDKKPRYTFDMVTPIIDQISGEMERAEFGINVMPAGGDGSKDDAKTYMGLVRNIQNISEADEIYDASGRRMVRSGIDGWRIVQRYADDNSFHQDFIIEAIPNFVDRAWVDEGAQKRDWSDCEMAWVMTAFTEKAFKKKWPDASPTSAIEDRASYSYFNKPGLVMVGECYYYREVDREIVLMSNGKVYEVTDDFKSVVDDLALKEIKEVSRRKTKMRKVYIRKFNVDDWLDDEKETAFAIIPVIPTFGNWDMIENKPIYFGAVEKIIDPQRVMNYTISREIEEGALAPRAKYWMSEKQQAGHEAKLATLNVNSDPVQTYNPDPLINGGGPPTQQGGAQINPGLRTISESMNLIINQSAGLFAANMGDNPNAQSGVAIERLQNKGDNASIKYFSAMEIAIRQTARILVKSIPRLYTDERQVRLLHEDRSMEMVTLNERQVDQQTGQEVVLNDLSKGIYDVVVSAGPAFQNKQQETVEGILEMAQVYPGLIEMGLDVLLRNTTTPGMDTLADRARKQLLDGGMIPIEEMTDDEKMALVKKLIESSQNPQVDPAMLIGQAELISAQTEAAKEQRQGMMEGLKAMVENRKQDREDIKEMRAGFEAQNKALLDLTTMLKNLKDATGAQQVISPTVAGAYQQTAQTLQQSLPQYTFDRVTGQLVRAQ